jgi:hypothetical protein
VLSPEIISTLLKKPVGDRTDIVLKFLLEPRFMGYWTFSRPKSEGIELADALVWFGDTVLLFEAKTRETGDADKRWIGSKLEEAIGQLVARTDALRMGKVQTLRNRWRGEIRWKPESVNSYYGLVVLNHLSGPYDPRDLVPDSFQKSTLPVQVFSLADLAELLRYIDTTYDFIVYYELRAELGKRWKLNVHEEGKTYSRILSSMAEILPATMNRGRINETIDFQKAVTRVISGTLGARRRDYERLAASYLLDVAAAGGMEEFGEYPQDGSQVEESRELYVEGSGAIAEMSRLRRSVWGRRWLELADSALRTGDTRLTSGHSPMRNRAYLFGATWKEGQSRDAWLSREALRIKKELRCSTCLGLAANPRRIRWTFDGMRRFMRRVKSDDLKPDQVLDATLIWVSNP